MLVAARHNLLQGHTFTTTMVFYYYNNGFYPFTSVTSFAHVTDMTQLRFV